MAKCSYDPKEMAGAPIGMFHCPECGEMVLAGVDHPDYEELDMEKLYQLHVDGHDGPEVIHEGHMTYHYAQFLVTEYSSEYDGNIRIVCEDEPDFITF